MSVSKRGSSYIYIYSLIFYILEGSPETDMCEASQKTKFKCDEIDIIISHQRTLKEAKQYPCDQCDYATSINIKNVISRNVKIPKTKVSDIKHNTFKFRNIYCNINLSFFYRKINSVKHMIEL